MEEPNPLDLIRKTITDYAENTVQGKAESNKWMYAACNRFLNDLQRTDIYFDWEEALRLQTHYANLSLVGEWSKQKFTLHPWQLFIVSNIVCWKWTESKKKRFRLTVVQVARGNGKTTLLAGLSLYDLMNGDGKRVHVIANN